MKNLLFITNDVIGDTSAGPGIRYVELGKAMAAKGFGVRLMGRKPRFASSFPFVYARLTCFNLIKYVKECDVVIIRGGGPLTTLLVLLFGFRKEIVADLYAFTQFEVPHILSGSRRQHFLNQVRNLFHAHKLKLYSRYINEFWVANERQRNFLYGVLYSERHLSQGKRISIIPFGYPAAGPHKRKSVLRGEVRGIGQDDFILIWGGGVWDWLDPLTLVKAMARVGQEEDKIKLYFMGVQAPSGYLPKNATRLIEISRSLGLLNKNVFVHTGWVPYQARTDYLLDANAGISLHPDSLETHYSFRTRTLDYIYCGLPMIHTRGDVWAETIEKSDLGIVVPPRDEQAVADAIIRLYRDKKLFEQMRINIKSNFREFTWESIATQAAESIEQKENVARVSYTRRLSDVFFRYLIFGFQTFWLFLRTALLNPVSAKGETV